MAPPKTGTTTLTTVLRQNFEAQLWDFTGIVPVRTSKEQEKEYIWPRHIIHLPEELSDYFVFATMRNPYRHAMSQYCNHCVIQNKEISMREFHGYLENFEQAVLCGLLHLIDYTPPKGCVKFKVQKFLDTDDKFEENFNLLPFVDKPIILPHQKKSFNERLFYTQEMADLVLEKRKQDFDFFGYDTRIPEDLRAPKCSS